MRLDKDMMERLLKQDDESLWKSIVSIAKSKGVTLPQKTPNPEEMKKLRGVLANPDKIDMVQAMKLLNQYRKGR